MMETDHTHTRRRERHGVGKRQYRETKKEAVQERAWDSLCCYKACLVQASSFVDRHSRAETHLQGSFNDARSVMRGHARAVKLYSVMAHSNEKKEQ